MDADVFSDHESLSRAAAERVRALIEETLADQTDVALALAGGSTPRRLYQLLAEADLPWAKVHLFWGDERVVPHDHPASNVHLVRETLLRGADVPPPNVYPMPTDRSPDAAAAAYEETLRRAFADRPHTFDLALLGMGGDGHTASLFPEDDPDPDDPRWVRAVSAPPRHDVRRRLTCTLPVFNGARHALVLVSGASKREAVQAALDDRDERLPITRVRPRTPVHWLLDRDARPSGA